MVGKFIGKDYRGFKHGQFYFLRSNIRKINGMPCICIYNIYTGDWCPYHGLKQVLENWELELNRLN